jgi:hypothetical protein
MKTINENAVILRNKQQISENSYAKKNVLLAGVSYFIYGVW